MRANPMTRRGAWILGLAAAGAAVAGAAVYLTRKPAASSSPSVTVANGGSYTVAMAKGGTLTIVVPSTDWDGSSPNVSATGNGAGSWSIATPSGGTSTGSIGGSQTFTVSWNALDGSTHSATIVLTVS